MAFREKTVQVPTRTGDKVKHWISCPLAYHFTQGNDIFTDSGYIRYACTCDERANAEYWKMDQISNCAYEATGLLKPKQLMYGVVDKITYPSGTVEKTTWYCCSQWCADRYRKEYC